MSAPVTQEKTQSTDNHVHIQEHSHSHGCCHKKADKDVFRRSCGCLKTSDKLKQIINNFPAPPPPSPCSQGGKFSLPEIRKLSNLENFQPYAPTAFAPPGCRNSPCVNRLHTKPTSQPFVPHYPHWVAHASMNEDLKVERFKPELKTDPDEKPKTETRAWWLVAELVQLLQLFVTATALMLYYIIYCYMQLVYFTLQTAIYFHNADGPMKVTIAIVTLSALLVAFNIMLRLERCSWHGCKHDAYTNYT